MSTIKQYFKTKVPSEDTDIIHSESSDTDSELEELPNNKHILQKNLNFKKKKAHLLLKKKTATFQKEWLEIYRWLIYDTSKNLMFCSLCKTHNKQNKFGKGGLKNFKSSALGEHASTKDHTDATNREIAKAELIKVTNNAIDKTQQHVGALMKLYKEYIK
ncbi:unnamed protein product [Rhizophagus irregularis]|nr:unnamed protein product [Rhizophagus irregularis]CAB5113958.1 unnamed protein product [Rhizophagus irregularis]